MKKVTFRYFDPARHLYFNDLGEIYTSGSTVASSFYSKFESKEIATRQAFETGQTVDDVLNEYQLSCDIGVETGNTEHNFMEDCLNRINVNTYEERIYLDESVDLLDDCLAIDLFELEESGLKKYPHFFQLIVSMIEDGWVFYPEIKLFSDEHLLCGTSDLVAKKGKKVRILDYKTCKDELDFKSGYYSKLKFAGLRIKSKNWVITDKRYFKPLNRFQVCKGNNYTIQLSIYGKLLELKGYEVESCHLVHLQPILDGDDVLQFQYKLITVPYLSKEMDRVFKKYKRKAICKRKELST